MGNCDMEAAKAEEVNKGLKRNQVRLKQKWLDIKVTNCPMLEMQVLAAISVCLTAVSFGANSTITSAVIYTFQKDSDDQIKMSLEEASWLRKRKAILVH